MPQQGTGILLRVCTYTVQYYTGYIDLIQELIECEIFFQKIKHLMQ